MVANNTVIFNEVPDEGYPVPGQTLKKVQESLDLEAPLEKGSILAKTVALSLDPYMRGRMRAPGIPSYVDEFKLHAPLQNFGVSVVLRSENSSYEPGQHVYGMTEFKEYNVFSSEQAGKLKILPEDSGIPWSTWVGAAGMPGQTAWWGLKNIGQPKKDETIFISGAAGAVGQMVAALARAQGLKVIGSAGSDDKVAFLKNELKFDVAFNYKKEKTADVLAHHSLDIYWDNVGGETLDAALANMNEQGRIVSCGTISNYNGESQPITQYAAIFAKQLKMEGFIIIKRDVEAFYDEIPPLIASGQIKPREHVTRGFDNGESFVDVMTGGNFGKAVIVFDE